MQYVSRFLLIFRIALRSVKHAPRRSDKAPEASRGSQEALKKPQEGPKRVSRWPQEAPKTTPTATQDGPMTAQDGSQVTQELPRGPKTPPRGPKMPPRPPKSTPGRLQEPLMRAPRSLKRPKKGSAEWRKRKPLNNRYAFKSLCFYKKNLRTPDLCKNVVRTLNKSLTVRRFFMRLL